MKKFAIVFYFFFACYFGISAQNNALISYVQIKNNWINVFDNNGKKISNMPQSDNEVVGIDGTFFVVIKNSWIITYDINCERISQMPLSNNIVKCVAGETFTTEKNGWLIIYDKYCKEKSRRPI
jgi:N-acetylneuraminic acid mutarotase